MTTPLLHEATIDELVDAIEAMCHSFVLVILGATGEDKMRDKRYVSDDLSKGPPQMVYGILLAAAHAYMTETYIPDKDEDPDDDE